SRAASGRTRSVDSCPDAARRSSGTASSSGQRSRGRSSGRGSRLGPSGLLDRRTVLRLRIWRAAVPDWCVPAVVILRRIVIRRRSERILLDLTLLLGVGRHEGRVGVLV